MTRAKQADGATGQGGVIESGVMKAKPIMRDQHENRRRGGGGERSRDILCGVARATLLLVAGAGLAPSRAWAQQAATGDAATQATDDDALRLDPAISLDPSAPQVAALPGGLTPSFGQRSQSEGEWRFDFHGFLTAPLAMGFNTRANPMAGQSKNVLHAPPVVPDDLETFSHTGVIPLTYAKLNFSEGNNIVSANISIVARQANVSTSFLEPADQLGITDVFLSILPPVGGNKFHLQLYVGAFTSRYGAAGEYDEGRYGTPLIARIGGAGEQATIMTGFRNLTFVFEQGLRGQTNQASSSITPDVWNNFADAGAGNSFVADAHLGVSYRQRVTLGGHFIRAWGQDTMGSSTPDGRINIIAADARFSMGRFGHLYLAYSHTDALQARVVSRIISVLNTQGGKGLMDNYLGDNSGGTGKLDTVGGQYDLSIGRLVSYPVPFSGDGPDLFVSLFAMQTHVSSAEADRDNVTKRKLGVEATYSLLSWFAASMRYDRVDPGVSQPGLQLLDTAANLYSFAVLSPRIIFRTDWQATDQVVLQYSHWFNGSRTTVRTGDPPMEDLSVVPDSDTVTLSASMWW